jgi:hypothetical protein
MISFRVSLYHQPRTWILSRLLIYAAGILVATAGFFAVTTTMVIVETYFTPAQPQQFLQPTNPIVRKPTTPAVDSEPDSKALSAVANAQPLKTTGLAQLIARDIDTSDPRDTYFEHRILDNASITGLRRLSFAAPESPFLMRVAAVRVVSMRSPVTSVATTFLVPPREQVVFAGPQKDLYDYRAFNRSSARINYRPAKIHSSIGASSAPVREPALPIRMPAVANEFSPLHGFPAQ